MKSPIQLFIAIAILLATATVAAQVYKWVDKDGQVQYTDTPPLPGATKAEAKKVDTGSAAPSSTAPTLETRAKNFEKRRASDAEKDKKVAEAQKKADFDAENCKIANMRIRDFESGRPLKRTNDQGEATYRSDETRLSELTQSRALAATSCKG